MRVCGYTITAKVKLYIELYYYSIELKVVVCRGARVSMTTLDEHSEAQFYIQLLYRPHFGT